MTCEKWKCVTPQHSSEFSQQVLLVFGEISLSTQSADHAGVRFQLWTHKHTRHTWAHHRHTQQHSWLHASESHPVYAGFACIHLCWGPAAWARPPACCPPTASPAESSTTHTHTLQITLYIIQHITGIVHHSSPKNSNVLALRWSQIRMSLFLHQVCRNGSQQWMLCSEWVPSEWESEELLWTCIGVKNVLMLDLFQLLSSPDDNWWTGVLWCFYQTLILTAPIHCRASITETLMQRHISTNPSTSQMI